LYAPKKTKNWGRADHKVRMADIALTILDAADIFADSNHGDKPLRAHE
jgi:hypothetical protein